MIIVSLTTIPPNFFMLPKQIENLLELQTVTPDLIVINIAEEYCRFKSDVLSIVPKSLNENVVVNFCTDSGPATKIIGLLESGMDISDDDTIVILDDDMDYPKQLCEDYLSTFDIIKNEHETILGVVGSTLESRGKTTKKHPLGLTEWTEDSNSHLKEVNVLQGWGSYAMKGSALKKLKGLYAIHHFPDDIFFQDDLFNSNFYKKHFKLRVMQSTPKRATESKGISPEFQMHLSEKNLGGIAESDGNIVKNLRGLSLYIEKGILNFDIAESRKKEILFHNFVDKFGDFVELEDLEDLTVEESIDLLKKLEKNIVLIKTFFAILSVDNKKINSRYTKEMVAFADRFGISKTIDKFLDKLPFAAREKRKKKAAVIFHIPMNGSHGCQTRALESIKSLLKLGLEVHLLSKNDNLGTENRMVWSESDADSIKNIGVHVLDVFDPKESEPFISPTWSKHIQQKMKSENYDFILVNYEHVLTPELYSEISKIPCVIDTHDDVHLNGVLQEEIKNLTSLEDCRMFYARRRLQGSNYTDQNIPKIFISKDELTRLGSVADCFIPHVVKPFITKKTFSGNPFFIGSDNFFNRRGLDLLSEVIDFPLDIVGRVAEYIDEEEKNENLNIVGKVKDLSNVYESAAFSVCPLVLGTGSKIKIQESLANATPVVAMIDSGLESDIIHGVNGFLCYTTEEFIDYCNLLNSDRALCNEMGKAAEMLSRKNDNNIKFEEFFEAVIKIGDAKNMLRRSK